jgi:serine/threonine-protein kinase HipA
LIKLLVAMARQIPDEVNAARVRAREEGLKHAIVEQLATQLVKRAGECQRMLESASA